jgi:hypothetical protein
VEYRQLGRSGLRISAITLGTMGFGGGGVFAKVGTGDVQDARRQIDIALEAGVNMIDTDVYSMGKTEKIVGQALGTRRDDVISPPRPAFRWAMRRTTRIGDRSLITPGPLNLMTRAARARSSARRTRTR